MLIRGDVGQDVMCGTLLSSGAEAHCPIDNVGLGSECAIMQTYHQEFFRNAMNSGGGYVLKL